MSYIEEFPLAILTSPDAIFLIDTNVNTAILRGLEKRTYTTLGMNAEKTGDYFKNVLSEEHILNFSMIPKDFKISGGEATITTPWGSAAMMFSTKNSIEACLHCKAPTSWILTDYLGRQFGVCQNISNNDFSLLVLTASSSSILLVTEDACLGYSSATTGSISFEKSRKWYDYYYVR